jgi:hypothetical protein
VVFLLFPTRLVTMLKDAWAATMGVPAYVTSTVAEHADAFTS